MDKKHVVFMLDFYHPRYSANGICAKKIIDTIKEDYKVTVIAINADEGSTDYEIFEAYDLRRIETKEHYIRNRYKAVMSNSNSNIKKLIYTGLFRYVQLNRYLRAIITKQNIIKVLVKTYINALRNIDCKIDMIIPLCYPFETIVAALEYKRKNDNDIIVIPYLFDNFSASKGLHRTEWNMRLKMKRHLLLEKEMMENSNHIFATWDWEQHIKKYFLNYEKKVTFVDIPALCEISNSVELNFETEKIHFVYTGALNKMVRPPEYTLKIITECMERMKDILLHLYIGGNCETVVNRYVELSKHNIINHGSVGIEIVYSALMQSNILISIGNLDITQFPSKIYEYMASGKPIIHFYQKDNDPVNSLLGKYPMSCCLSQKDEDFESNVEQVLIFVQEYFKAERVDYSEVRKRFESATPEYSSGIIRKILN